jgi:ribosome maturation factor RimP
MFIYIAYVPRDTGKKCAGIFLHLGIKPFFYLYKIMIENELTELFAPTVESLGYELWGIEYLAQGKHSLLRVYIDKEDGIGIEDCQAVSRQISALLDVEDPISGNYSLEISSPGIPRPLFQPWQYERYIGSEVQLKTFKPVDGKRKISGTVVLVSDKAVVLMINDQQCELLFSNIAKASLAI